jgi:hypothetical protein
MDLRTASRKAAVKLLRRLQTFVCAGVFHQVPTIRNLGGMWKRLCNGLAITAAPISGDNVDGWVCGKPGS